MFEVTWPRTTRTTEKVFSCTNISPDPRHGLRRAYAEPTRSLHGSRLLHVDAYTHLRDSEKMAMWREGHATPRLHKS